MSIVTLEDAVQGFAWVIQKDSDLQLIDNISPNDILKSAIAIQSGTTYTLISTDPLRWVKHTGEKGATGHKGDQGVQGPVGDPGPRGLTGPTGPAGDNGDTGPRGLTGQRGPQGPRGERGPVGARGPQGARGETGPKGADGPKGEKGDAGPRGYTGPQGPIGEDGPQGERGPQGPQGIRGPQGEQGEKGEPGPRGERGPMGKKGDRGPKGETGPQGLRGEKGPMGPRGPQGPQGKRGLTGPKGDTVPEPVLVDESGLENATTKLDLLVATSKKVTLVGNYNAAYSSKTVNVEGSYNTVEASVDTDVLGNYNSVFSSAGILVKGNDSYIASSKAVKVEADNSGILASENCEVEHNNTLITNSKGVKSNASYTHVYGYGEGEVSETNQTIRIESKTGKVYVKGGLVTAATGYAEYFENLELGKSLLPYTFVTLDKGKVRPSNSGDRIALGVVVTDAAIIGNAQEVHWKGRFKTKDNGELVYEKDEKGNLSPVVSDEYDATRTYIPRSDRTDEWSLVALSGRVPVLAKGNLSVGDRIDYLGQKSSSNRHPMIVEIIESYDPDKGYGIVVCVL